jgi:GH24 family phage-related lysozyme (muramidase)
VKTSENGIELLKRFEGLELEAYQDIAGIWTIGYGHTGDDVQPGMKLSEREAEELLRRDLKPREQAVSSAVKVSLNQNEFDALVSFVYNVGAAAFRGSTALKRLNRGDRVGAADALTWWNKATVGGVLREVLGLTRRRAAEKALFLTPTAVPDVRDPEKLAENPRVTPVEDSPRRGSVAESRTVQGAAIAGGAGVASSTMGRDSADKLDQLETNIENGEGLTENPATSGDGGAAPSGETQTDGGSTAAPGGETETGAPATGEETGSGDGAATSGDAQTGEPTAETIQITERPSKHETHAVEAQVQFALLILIILSVLFIIFARIDDWFKYRR